MGEPARRVDVAEATQPRLTRRSWIALVNRSSASRNARHVALYLVRLPSFPLSFCKVATVAGELGVSYSTAYRGLRELRELHLLRSAAVMGHRGQLSNDYLCEAPSNVGQTHTHAGPAPSPAQGSSFDDQISSTAAERRPAAARAEPNPRETGPDLSGRAVPAPACQDAGSRTVSKTGDTTSGPAGSPLRPLCSTRPHDRTGSPAPTPLERVRDDLAALRRPNDGAVKVSATQLGEVLERFGPTAARDVRDVLGSWEAVKHPDAARDALLRLAQTDPREVEIPGAYFRALLRRAIRGELRLGKSHPRGGEVMDALARKLNDAVTGVAEEQEPRAIREVMFQLGQAITSEVSELKTQGAHEALAALVTGAPLELAPVIHPPRMQSKCAAQFASEKVEERMRLKGKL